jgi:molecular chaperone IbpA
MRTNLDFSHLFRSSIGFERMLNALEAASRIETRDNWPTYDIVKTGDDAYRNGGGSLLAG